MNKLDPINNRDAIVAWTIQEVQELRTERVSTRTSEAKPNSRLGALAADALQTISQIVGLPLNESESEDLRACPDSHVVEQPNLAQAPESDTVAKPAQDLPSVSSDISTGPLSSLLKAIVKPDIYVAPIDRDRAINLRWVLRDIKNNRLALSPVGQQDLKDLIDMGLIEMRDNTPVLTSAGVCVIN
jgi:hypothetical protein